MGFVETLYIFVALCVIWKLFIKLTTGIYRGNETLYGKTVIVTGANSGIGYFAAKDFSQRGARVVMVCRNLKKAENAKFDIIKETGNSNIKIYQVDFSSLDSVRQGANEILNNEDKIDVLLNNAGVASAGYNQVSKEGLNCLMLTNYFGPFLFTNILLGKIKHSAPSRVVNVSSMSHLMGTLNKHNFKNTMINVIEHVYSNSKLGNILFTKELARKLQGTGVTTNSLHPGAFASDIMKDRGRIYRFVWNRVMPFVFKTVEEGAQTSIYLCVSSDVENISGEYFQECKLTKSSSRSMNLDFAQELWDLTEEAVNLQPSEKHYA